ncbi:SurA N-terminal domain-containing protein [Agaribacter flavus]|uniref:Periplasmic chaperone PpiD n=1 Tax=Agaribacter flavus TaxID=1902781 RepID=A0ABV7FPA4_9ALTE
MLERIREGIQGPWAIAIVALIVVSFVFTGVGSYLSGGASTAVAVVNDEEISAQALDGAFQSQRRQMEAQFGEAVSTLFANENYLADFRRNVLDGLIADVLISQKATSLGLRVSDEQIKEAIVGLPEFQVAGEFSNDVYNASIRRAGFTPAEFAEYMRVEMTRTQLRNAISGTTISLDSAAKKVLKLQGQKRDAKVLEVSSSDYLADIVVGDDEINNYYNNNITQYDTEEQVKLSFISLSVDNILPSVTVTDDELQTYYQENLSYYQTPEKREIAHILFEATEGEDAALQEAEQARKRLEAGEDFAKVALELSDDIVSAEEGGELGEVNVGDYEESFTDAAFALSSVGEISEPVKTEFGYHLIKLSAYTPTITQTFDEVEADILTELKREKALDEFFTLQAEMERIAFESSDSLDDIADAIDRPVLETNFFTTTTYPASVDYPQVQNVAFSSELINDAVNSELLTVSDEKVMVVRVAAHKPQRTLALEEVVEDITNNLKADKAQQAALVWAQELQVAISQGENINDKLAEKALEWSVHPGLQRNSTEISRQLNTELFSLSLDNDNNSAVVTLSNGNVGVVKLDAIHDADEPTNEDVDAFSGRYASQQAQRTFENYIDALKSQADIKITQ